MLLDFLLAETQKMLEPVEYDVQARTDYDEKYIRLKLYHISPTRKYGGVNLPSRSGIAISLDPALLWEHNKKGVQLAIDALVRHIEREDNE